MLFRLLVLVPLESLFHAVCFLLDYLFFPRLWNLKVLRPVFIVGHARSGTTLAHRLLSADGETFSYFLYWEMFFPSLLQKKCIKVLGKLDAALLNSAINRRLVAWDDKTFGRYRHMHDMSMWNSEEDQFVMRAAFVTQQWSLDVPMMDIIDIFHVDQMPAKKRRSWLNYYRECVKRQLLLNGEKKIHLSKNPVMSGWVEALIETFPDARFVVMMRDPASCMPSVLKLVELTWKGKGWSKAQYADSLRILTDVSFDTYRNPKEALARHPETPQCVVDYRRITTEPRATVTEMYKALDLPMSDAFDAYLIAQEEREKSHSTHFEYSIDDYELSAERIETELAEFYTEYQWPRTSSKSEESGEPA